MKSIKIISFLLIVSLKVSAQQITAAEMQVTGLTCSMCSQATEKSLRTLDFISDVKPDLNKNLFVLTFKKDRPVNIDLLKLKVQDAGFSIGSLTADFNFEDVKVDAAGQAMVDGTVYRFENVKNKTLTGPMKLRVIDKNFISSSAFKQKAKQVHSDAYASGTAVINGKKTRVYHLSV